MQYETKTHKIHTDKHKWIYAQWNGPSVTKPNPENCKNCSSKCAYNCAQLQYTIQHRTVLIISPLKQRGYAAEYNLQKWINLLKIFTTNIQCKAAVIKLTKKSPLFSDATELNCPRIMQTCIDKSNVFYSHIQSISLLIANISKRHEIKLNRINKNKNKLF